MEGAKQRESHSRSRRALMLALGAVLAVALMGCGLVSSDPDPPEVAEPIADQEMQADAEPVEINLEAVFDDPAGEGLGYVAESSDPEIAAASARAATLEVEPGAVGEATVTAVAENDGGEATASFEVTVTIPDAPGSPD